ncbi:MAG: glycosyltransferase family 4 protein, partial [Actinomycetota bacterium]|nr:glycosyltransferase family 4 protein [Actinomycetota bacterium]
MERYADRVGHGVAASGRFNVDPVAMQRDRVGWAWHLDRLVAYTVSAGRRGGDLFHIVDHGFAHLARLLPRDRTIVTCHDLMALRSVMGQTGTTSRAITVARFRWSVGHMRRVAHVVCDSTATRDDALELVGVPEDRVTVISLGVDERFRPLASDVRERVRRELGLNGLVVVGNVATGADYKNPAGALHTLRILHDRGVPAVLLRSGRGFAAHHLELQRRLGLDGFVVERGILDEEDLIRTYNACDVLLHPSYWEGFGWPPLEAMSCGTPVVTSTAPSLLEVTAGSALAAGPDDHAGLAD